MQSFKIYCEESEAGETRTTTISQDEGLSLLKTDYSQAYEKYHQGIKFYRGVQKTYHYAIAQPSKFNRLSSSAKIEKGINAHNFLMDALPSWSEFPKRSKSLMFATVESGASLYASSATGKTSMLYVFPKNNAKIALANSFDIWGSRSWSFLNKFFTENDLGMLHFDRGLAQFITIFLHIATLIDNGGTLKAALMEIKQDMNFQNNLTKITPEDNDQKVFFQSLVQLGEEFSKHPEFWQIDLGDVFSPTTYSTKYYTKCVRDCLRQTYKGNFIDTLDYLFNPTKNKFNFSSIANFPEKTDCEAWTESDCLLVNKFYSNEL